MPASDTWFTTDNAREMSAKGRAALALRRQLERQAADEAARKPTAEASNGLDPYQLRRLNRVRKQLDLIDKQIEEQAKKETPDGQTLNWLAAAQARLSEQERQLSNRSLPPTIRAPSKGPAKKLPNAAPPRSAPSAPSTEPANDPPSDPGDEPTAASVV